MVVIISSCLWLSAEEKSKVGGGGGTKEKRVHEKLKERRGREKSMSMSGQ